jgi:hypothetical protein
MPARTAAFFDRSPAFAVAEPAGSSQDGSRGRSTIQVVARYPERDLLLSGWLMGDRVIANRAAVAEARVERGRVVLLGFRTQHRGQSHATFKLLFNSLYLGAP